MNLNALIEKYQTLLPWNLSRTKCFVSMILEMIVSGSVQQHKTSDLKIEFSVSLM